MPQARLGPRAAPLSGAAWTDGSRDPITPLLLAGACAAATLWIGIGAFDIGGLTRADNRVLIAFSRVDLPRGPAITLSHLTGPGLSAIAAVAMVAVAVLRGRPRLAAAMSAIVLGANLTTQVIQHLVSIPRYPLWLPDAIWPSGHTTAAMSLAICAVLLAPPARRLAVAVITGLGVVAVVFSILRVGLHHPSDALAGMTVTGAWTGLAMSALAATGGHDARPIQAPQPALAKCAMVVAVCVIAITAICMVVPLNGGATDLTARLTLATGAVVMSAVALTITVATSRADA
jgi:membrane-associated phospholipid phosphatase